MPLAVSSPLVSVIIPVHNRSGMVGRAIASVLNQTWQRLEIVVVDDGSEDNTAERVREGFGERVYLLVLPRNRGVSYARNRGIEFSRGDYIALLDSDDSWAPDKISRQLAYLARHPELLLCQSEEIWVRHGRRVNPCRHHRKPDGELFPACLERCLVTPSAVMMHRSFFARIGLFDETLPACEDYDLWLRTAAAGLRVGLLPEKLLTRYGGHADQLSAVVPALDRYRIRALCKLLKQDRLSPVVRRAAKEVLRRKSRIYLNGCRRRGRYKEMRVLAEQLGRVFENGFAGWYDSWNPGMHFPFSGRED